MTCALQTSFQAVFYELAMAYRWQATGVKVRLASVLDSGRIADFAAEIADTKFIVEASIFPKQTSTRSLSGSSPPSIRR